LISEHGRPGLQQLGGKVVRAATLARDELAITLQCVACNVKRRVWLAANVPAH
jgi:transposase, IS5 family